MANRETQTDIEPERQRYSPEEFIYKLYDAVMGWLREEKRAEVVAEFDPCEVNHWESQSTFPPGTVILSNEVQKAVLISDDQNIYAIVLGRRKRSRYDPRRTLGLQFGFVPSSEHARKSFGPDSKIEDLRSLVKQDFTYGSGEFYVNALNAMGVDCWADDWQFGGKEVSRWTRDRLLTDEGIGACIEIIKRLEERAFF